jgi:hypothetical protein
MSRRHTLASVALLSACDTPSVPPEPRPTAAASSTIAPAAADPPARGSSGAPRRMPAAPDAAAPADPDDLPTCQKGPGHHGGWTPSASEVMAIVPRLRDVDCGDPAWRRDALERCTKEQGQSNVTVRFEWVGDQPFMCWLGVTGATWHGRRFLVVRDSYFEGPTAWGYTNVYELTRAGPVLFLDGAAKHSPLCQGSRTDPTVAKPPGWSTFPKDLQEALCGP